LRFGACNFLVQHTLDAVARIPNAGTFDTLEDAALIPCPLHATLVVA